MKGLGIILIVLGALVGACSKIVQLQSLVVKTGLVSQAVLNTWGIYVAGGLVVLGLLVMILMRESGSKEVPIYEGNQVVGYRRH